MTARTFFEGCGIGIGVTLNYTWGHLSPRHIEDLYLRVLPVNSVIGGATLDLLAVSAVGIALILALDRFDPQCRTPAWAAAAALVLAILVRTTIALTEMSNHGLSSTLLFLILFLPGLALWHRSSKVYGVLVSGFRWSMLGLGVCILWMTPRLIYMFVQSCLLYTSDAADE